MSTHEILVVQVENVFPHENADSLEIIKIADYDYSILSKKGQFKKGDLAVYVEPDYIVSTEVPEFSFLFDGKRNKIRITTKRLRGIWSDGLLIPARSEFQLGQNVIDILSIDRYEPKLGKGFTGDGGDLKSGWAEKQPPIHHVKYDLENYKKYGKLISDDDVVFFTTKIHGANARFVFHDGEFYCGSRTTWKSEPGKLKKFSSPQGDIEKIAPDNSWWNALNQNSWLQEFCKNHPDHIVYAEIFGESLQGAKFHYGYKGEKLGVRVFDIMYNGEFLPFSEIVRKYSSELKFVPILFHGKMNKELLENLAEENESSIENCGEKHIREGVVIRLECEKYNSKIGRIALKYVSRNYLTRG